MTLKQFDLPTKVKRWVPDPLHKHDLDQRHYWCFVNIYDLYKATKNQFELPYEPNPREQEESVELTSPVMKAQRETFLDSDTPFHQWNLGITIFCEKVEEDETNRGILRLYLSKDDGISNGGTTYRNMMQFIKELITKEGIESVPKDEFVWIGIRTKIPASWSTSMAEAHNKTTKVLETALLNAENHFDEIKKTLKGTSYSNEIVYKQNAPGGIDISIILRILEALDVARFPNEGDKYPTHVYSGSGKVISEYKKRVSLGSIKEENFHNMLEILPDALKLFDTIRLTFPEYASNKLLNQPWIKEKETKLYFINKYTTHDLLLPALFPILSSFRNFIEHDSMDQPMYWKTSFKNIVIAWEENAKRFLQKTQEVFSSTEKVHEIGRNKYHWISLHEQMDFYYKKTFQEN